MVHRVRAFLLQLERRGEVYEISQELLPVEQRDCVDCKGTGWRWLKKCPSCGGSGDLLDNQLWMLAHGYRAVCVGHDGRMEGWLPKECNRWDMFTTTLESRRKKDG